ncbi:glycosyltransferase involved in cell wall biosynthesis [Salinibacter ruber]|uniref:glycosyltransferase family 2 protein n=1 Tax=Salinibacter ruber TaxID=146919 RepID=UPI00216A575F|nr:glycosyltransferase family 2 protein [Salinibacter ruber]MCS3935203.1 glycosyltransferase involved in cell wall biosynthesis [Salinibacter ruber]MCS4043238.1 glycosyltransferase involved in cell wall biosynthesis [Salinibacter ruber]
MDPLVSVIIPTHNRPNLLPRALASVFAQTFHRFECFVVDDGSSCDVRSVVDRVGDDRVKYLSHSSSRGASAARNTGIEASNAKYVAFLDDDDEWRPSKLRKQVDLFEESPPGVGLIYTWMNYYKEGGKLYRTHSPTFEGHVFPYVFDEQRIGGCPTLLVLRNVVENVGGFDEGLPRGNDGDFIRRVCKRCKVRCIPEVLVNVFIEHGEKRISNNDEKGLLRGIKSHKSKLRKFPDECEKYPRRTANIYASIASNYAKMGRWRESKSNYLKAIRMAPISYNVIKNIIVTLLVVLNNKFKNIL